MKSIMDEINFSSGPADAKMAANAMMKTYRAVKSRMKSRFISSGRPLPTLLWMISSKKSEYDFLEQYANEVKDDPATYIVDEPIWNVKPKGTYCGKTFKVAVGNKFLASKIIEDKEDPLHYDKQGYRVIDVPIEFKADFKKDVDGALMDIAGISASSTLKYLSVETMMETMLPTKNPFTTDILVIGTKDKLRIQDFFRAELVKERDYSKPIYIHIDMSQSGDKTGITAIAIDGAKRIDDEDPDAEPELYYKMLFGVDIKAPSDAQIDFKKTRQFIYYLKHSGWNIKCVSTDGFQSTDTQQRIAEHGITAKLLSLDRSPTGYEILKQAINEHRVGLLNIELLKQEAAEIQKDSRTGKIDHPEGGCFTGDTKVSLVDGRELSFLELLDEYENGKLNYVYSYNHEEQKIEPKKINKVWLTKHNANLVEVTLDNGEIIRCTPNHRFMLRDGSYKEAQYLSENESLMPNGSPRCVISVISLEDVADVYDLEVEDNHNFALTSGIFVHNSKDLLDSLAGALWSASMDKASYVFEHGEDLSNMLEVNMQPADTKMQLMKDLHDMLAQDADTAKQEAQSIIKRANERKVINLTNMTEMEKAAYTQQTFEDANREDVYAPDHLDDSYIII